jgi:hypothetical protein
VLPRPPCPLKRLPSLTSSLKRDVIFVKKDQLLMRTGTWDANEVYSRSKET